MVLPTAKKIMSLYLFGQDTPPTNRVDINLIRPEVATSSITVDRQEFMTIGAGRFAVGAHFKIVQDFFNTGIALPIKADGYTIAELGAALGYAVGNKNHIKTISQDDWKDSGSYEEYAERVFIYHSTDFEIASGARFVVAADGTRTITNFAVQPQTPDEENFDFVGQGTLTNLINGLVVDAVDPSGIGRTVNFNFTGTVVPVTYTSLQFSTDSTNIIDWAATASETAQLSSKIVDLIESFWTDGITKSLDSSNRPIVYGTNGDDVLDYFDAKKSSIFNDIGQYTGNGLVLIGGAGNDTLYGSITSDILYGGTGNDNLYGFGGNDTLSFDGGFDRLDGGSGNDAYLWDKATVGQINITDATGQDTINLTGFSSANLWATLTGSTYIAYTKGGGLGPSAILIVNDFNPSTDDTYFHNPDNSSVLLSSLLSQTPTDPVPSYTSPTAPMGHLPDGTPYGAGLGELLGNLPQWLLPVVGGQQNHGTFGNASNWAGWGSPLILDLDGDGVEVNNLKWGATGSHTYFDMDNDGFAERTAWVTGGDGLLVRDLNANGTIDGQSELFGNDATYADGFAKLATLDTNADNIITIADAAFGSLKVWVDANMDGVSQTEELKTLADLNITSINVNATALTNTYINENLVSDTATFTINGQTRTVSDVWFRLDQTDTQYTGNVTINPATLFLPTLRGFGALKDLHVAMSEDATLLGLVQSFADTWSTAKFANYVGLNTEIQNILYRWAGVDTIPAGTQIDGVDARVYTFIEKLTGYPNSWLQGSPSPALITTVSNEFVYAFTHLRAALITQVGGSAFFDGDFRYDLASGSIVGSGSLSEDALAAARLEILAGTSNEASQYWSSLNSYLFAVRPYNELSATELSYLAESYSGNPSDVNSWWQYSGAQTMWSLLSPPTHLDGDSFSNLMVGSVGGDNIHGFGGNDEIHGGNTGDGLWGDAGDDILYGDAGDDTIYGDDNMQTAATGADILIGGTGNDYLSGNQGNDIYIYNLGDGLDTIEDKGTGGLDVLRFGPGITAANITLQRDQTTNGEYDLKILLNGSLIALSKYQFAWMGQLERLEFDDGSFIDLTPFHDVIGTSGNDTLNGLDLPLLTDDRLSGSSGNDTLNGGLGNDLLDGANGTDTYIYSAGAGMGTDLIRESGSEIGDKIIMGSGYMAANVSLQRVGTNDLAIVSGGQTRLLIEGQFEQYKSIETLQYGDGSTLNLLNVLYTLDGTSGNDTLTGTSYGAGGDIINGLAGNDTLTGGLGNDVINGGDGNDTLLGDNSSQNAQDGNDTLRGGAGNDYIYTGGGNDTVIYDSGLDMIYAKAGVDTLEIATAGITAANLTITRTVFPGNYMGLDIKINGVSSVQLMDQYGGGGYVQTVRFANGSTLNLTTTAYALNGTSGVDSLYGSSAGANPNDVINGLAGNDYLIGFDGNDILNGGAGADSIDGGNGSDTADYSTSTAAVTIDLQNGTYTGGDAAGDTFTSIENVTGSGYTDFLYGNTVANILTGGSGGDFLEGGGGADVLNGGSGNDTVVYTRSTSGVTLNLATNTGTGGDATGDTFTSIENVTGSAYADTITGGTWGETIKGQNGNDAINGGDGNDVLMGEGNDDTLHGNNGNDTLYGGSGTDILYGDAGADIFRFSVASMGTIDTIKDFSTAQADKLNIQDILVGWNATTKVITDYLELTTSGANTIMKVDRDGLGTAYAWSQTATLEGVTGLTDEQALLTAGNVVA